MIIEDTELEVFPECPTFGMITEPMYDVRVIKREGGFERRNRRWAMPLHRYSSVPMGNRADEDIQQVLYFWHAMGGREKKFRRLDYADYKSCRTHEDESFTDATLVIDSDTSPEGYTMWKHYTFGPFEQARRITRPIGSTITVGNELGVLQDSTLWTVDEATGIIYPEPGFSGTPTTWGGQFHVPCRFDSELPIELTNRQISALTFALMEVRE